MSVRPVARRGAPRFATPRSAALALFLLLGSSACSWFTDFKEQPKIDPWESPNDTTPFRGNPQGSVPVFGSAAPGYQFGRMPLPAVIDSMKGISNPVPADARSLENGRKQYQINCSPCHGPQGMGDGSVVKYGYPGMGVGLGSNAATTYTDGYIFGMIRNGRGLMPPYNRIEEADRWDLINYLRALQGKLSGVTAIAGPVGRPGETGPLVPGASTMGPTRPAPYYKRVGSQAGPSEPPVVVPIAVPGSTAAAQPPATAAPPNPSGGPGAGTAGATDTTKKRGARP